VGRARPAGIVGVRIPTGRFAMPAEVVELRSEAGFKKAFPVIRGLHGGWTSVGT
jgi:hypothetical protein